MNNYLFRNEKTQLQDNIVKFNSVVFFSLMFCTQHQFLCFSSIYIQVNNVSDYISPKPNLWNDKYEMTDLILLGELLVIKNLSPKARPFDREAQTLL